jgi:spermidine synthase
MLNNTTNETAVPRSNHIMLLSMVLLVSVCGLIYEMVIGSIASDLSGGSSAHYSFIIGLYLFAMGVGAGLSRRIPASEVEMLVYLEVAIGIIGGSSATVLHAAHSALGPSYNVVMFTLTLIIGTGVGMEIPLFARIAARYQGLEKTLAEVLSFDCLGALIASILFPILLLPVLGLTRAALVVGLLNIAAALLAIRLGDIQIKSHWMLLSMGLIPLVVVFFLV